MSMPRHPKAPPRCIAKSGKWYWEPSERLRNEGGFRTVPLGSVMSEAFAKARELNKPADAWLQASGPARKPKAKAPAHETGALTFGQLVARYRASHAYTSKRESTRKTYDKSIRILEREFADERLIHITRGRVLDWADPLRSTSPQGLRHHALLAHKMLDWAMERQVVALPSNPFTKIGVEPNRRGVYIGEDDLKWLVALADKSGRTDLGTAMMLGFFLVQRLWDVLALTEENLTGKGIKLQQSKTKAKVVIPTLPQPVAQRLKMYPPRDRLCWRTIINAKGEEVTSYPNEEGAQKGFADLRTLAVATCITEEGKRSPRAARLKGLQLRDMRRSGFLFYAAGKKDAKGRVIQQPVPVQAICAMSGHKIDEGMTIVETYLPKTPEQADMAVAMAGAKW